MAGNAGSNDEFGFESIFKFLSVLKRNSNAIVKFWIIADIFIILLCALAYFLQPSNKIASTEVYLEFKGAGAGEYPNGTRFSHLDIIADSVLRSVYDANDLAKYVSYENFKASVSIIQYNLGFDILDAYYGKMLSAKTLTILDRDKIEASYTQQKRALMIPKYRISINLKKKLKGIPSSLICKSLADIPVKWIDEVKDKKGIEKYNISLLSPAIVSSIEAESNELISFDLLNIVMNQSVANLRKVQALPAANQLRIKNSREEEISLEDLACDFTIFQNSYLTLFKLLLLNSEMSMPASAIQYLNIRLNDLQREMGHFDQLRNVYNESYKSYVKEREDEQKILSQQPSGQSAQDRTVLLSSGTDMLAMLQRLNENKQDLSYRQGLIDKSIDAGCNALNVKMQVEFYSSLLKDIESNSKKKHSDEKAFTALKEFKAKICKKLGEELTLLNKFYFEMSRIKFSAPSMSYSTQTPPHISSDRIVSSLRALLITFILLLLANAVIALIVFSKASRKGLPN